MGSSNTLKLSIPKPCSEQWENFDITREGGYCKNCEKTVVDFTQKDEAEIFRFFASRPAHACGRFRPDQLRAYRNRQPVYVKPGLRLLKAGLVSLFLLLFDKQVQAQTPVASPTEERIVVQSTLVKVQEKGVDVPGMIIKGVVISKEDGTGIPGVYILRKGTAQGTVTDMEGRFEFPAALDQGDILQFSFIGFVTEELKIRSEAKMPLEIVLKLRADITGEVYVEGVYEPPRHSGFFSKIKNLF